MKKVFLMGICLFFAKIIHAQISDMYYNAFVAYLKSEKVKGDTIHLIHKDFLDSTQHQGRQGEYFNYIPEAEFSKYCKENSSLEIYGVFPITFVKGEMRIRVVGYGVTVKKERLQNGNRNEFLTITSSSYVEYKILIEECGKKWKLEVISEH